MRATCRIKIPKCYYCHQYGHSDNNGLCPNRSEIVSTGICNVEIVPSVEADDTTRDENERVVTGNSRSSVSMSSGNEASVSDVKVSAASDDVTSDPVLKDVDASHGICMICADNPREIMYIPCNHIVICVSCDKELYSRHFKRNCIVCRREIKNRFRVYL